MHFSFLFPFGLSKQLSVYCCKIKDQVKSKINKTKIEYSFEMVYYDSYAITGTSEPLII